MKRIMWRLFAYVLDVLLIPGLWSFTLNKREIADFIASERGSYDEPEFVADVSCVFSPSRRQIEIWATVGVISILCWQPFGGSTPSCLLAVGLCGTNRKHIELSAAPVQTEPVGKKKLFIYINPTVTSSVQQSAVTKPCKAIRKNLFKWNIFIWHYFLAKTI